MTYIIAIILVLCSVVPTFAVPITIPERAIMKISDEPRESGCGAYFNADPLPGGETLISFFSQPGVSPGKKYLISVWFKSNIETRIDNSKRAPTIETTEARPNTLVLRISRGDYESSKSCLPSPLGTT